MNEKFSCIGGDLAELQINFNICSNDDSVDEIERIDRTVK